MRLALRPPALVAVALVAASGVATAQKSGPSLNTVELRELVSRGAPADHARLAVHYRAVSDQSSAEARRHTSMSQGFGGNPNRNVASGMSVHCKQLASLNTEAAKGARELAEYHQKLASGTTATPPRDPASIPGGTGAEPSEKELSTLAAKANTAADHHRLEEYFATVAKRHATEAKEHAALAATYRGKQTAQAAAIHDRLAEVARESAKEAGAAADVHKGLATGAR